ncbi:MAG TPA: exosortase A [Burkholderiales bacterium]|nr:exosortase A [Burkholderiales bacterium]
MKFDPDRLLLTADTQLSPPQLLRGWRSTLPIIAGAVLAILTIYSDTAGSIVAIWRSSDTFAHGYLIVPITLFLVWTKRREVAVLAPRPDLAGFLLLAAAGFAWLAAEAAQVQVLAQYTLVAMVTGAVLAVVGRRVAWTLAFPLAFLFFAVPFGEAFLPRLMQWTADFTVAALRVSGIPVYREGTFFDIPTGHWSVVEACSGLRYLIASVTIGAVFAYLTYRTWWKRALFLALAVAVPIIANFLRAYIIVLIGHLSGMKLAVGVDHFIYGWLFFGLVIGLLFWLGSLWREPAAPTPQTHAFLEATPATPAVMVCAALGTVVLAAASPLYLPYLDRLEEAPIRLAAPAGVSGWALEPQQAIPQQAIPWRPDYRGAAASTIGVYRKGEHSVAVYLGYYRNQHQGAELVGAQNLIAGAGDSRWAKISESLRTEHLPNGTVELRQTRLGSAGGRLLVWDWYRIAGHELSNPFMAKALLARDRLLRRGDDSAAIVLAAPYEVRPETAAETLRVFTREMQPAIDQALRLAAQKGSG